MKQMPRNSVAKIAAAQTSVIRALRHSGGLKAGTPSEIASTPVSAAAPELKARRMRKIVSASPPPSPKATPPVARTPQRASRPASHADPDHRQDGHDVQDVGAMKIVPDSRTPRRLPSMSRVTIPMARSTRSGNSSGMTDVIAATAAETDTATVSV